LGRWVADLLAGELLSMKRLAIFAAFFLAWLSAPCLAVAQTTVIFLTSGTSWTVPNNWNNANNTIEVIGSGGAHLSTAGGGYTGGNGGGSYSRISNLSLTPGNNVNYQIGTSGQTITTGGATWFNGTTISNASVSAEGGCSTTSESNCSNSTSSNIGTVIFAGGKGGSYSFGDFIDYSGSGGGAAGPYGAGQNGGSGCVNGGAGDNGAGGAGGTGCTGTSSNGGVGKEYTATNGATAGGGGGGGGSFGECGQTQTYGSGPGGNYGGGAGGCSGSPAVLGGNGLIVITYAPAPNIFTTNLNSSTVTAYPLGSSGNVTPLGSVTSVTGLAWPDGIARDSSGNLYVTNNNPAFFPSVTVFSAGSSGNAAPTITISGSNTGLINPTGIAVDSSSNIYVANLGSLSGQADSVLIFAAGSNGNVAPSAVIVGSSTGLAYPTALALDSSANIYIANSGSLLGGIDSITVYPAGSNGNVSASATISGTSTGLLIPSAIALDSSRNIYVANDGSQDGSLDSVTVYPANSNGNASPSANISGAGTALISPAGLAVDSSGNIYVTDDMAVTGEGNDYITVYAPGSNGNVSPSNTLYALGLGAPAGIVVDSNKNLYVANDGSTESGVDAITVYPPQDLFPSETIGMDTGLDSPDGIALDLSGKIYVTNDASNGGGLDSVNIYPPGSYAGGPVSTAIIGTSTGLTAPTGIAVNPSGNIYVANSLGGSDGLGSVTVYSAGSAGNAAPSATISGNSSGDNTGFNSPEGIALDSLGNLYVANAYGGPDGVGSITIYSPGANGNVTPLATISDNPNCAPCDKTTLNFPYGVALDASGKIYVANSAGGADNLGSVTVFPALATSTGTLNEAPSATIAGASAGNDLTGFTFPSGIVLDSAANIYVTNDGSLNGGVDSLTVYSAGGNGNVAPTSTISGSSTGLNLPQAITMSWNAGFTGGAEPAAIKPQRKPLHGKPKR
jgi:sugar lactone lactonase YvrE